MRIRALKYIHLGRLSRLHSHNIRNICRHRDLANDIYSPPFHSQLLPLPIRILHTILQCIITPRKGHLDEVTRMDVGLLDRLFKRRPVQLGYVILKHILSTPGVIKQLLPYGSNITKLLRHFHIPFQESIYMETERIGEEAITEIKFYRRNGEWVKMTTSKNCDTLVAFEDDRMLNNIYPYDQLSNFWLGARA